MTVVGILVVSGVVLGFAVAWNLLAQNRLLLERNRQVIQQCNASWASESQVMASILCKFDS